MRAGEKLPIQLQDRDYSLLVDMFESRVMTLAHVTLLHFEGKAEMAKKRVQKLKAAGLILERRRHVTIASALFLTRKAFQILRDHGKLSEYPHIGETAMETRSQVSDLTIRHELEVMDVKTAMTTAFRCIPKYAVAQFSTWPRLYEFKACNSKGEYVPLKPDGFIRIQESDADGELFEHTCFLEVDTGSETLDRVIEKCICYRDYQFTGGFAVFCRGKREEAKDYPFQVLVVCKSKERRNNLAEALLNTNPPFSTMVLITTQPQCRHDPLGDIWMMPKTVAPTTSGT